MKQISDSDYNKIIKHVPEVLKIISDFDLSKKQGEHVRIIRLLIKKLKIK